MRYSEPKDRAVALLRQALVLMGQHDVSPNPLTFAVFYEHLAGSNGRLSAALEALQPAQARLGDEHMRELYGAHIAAPGSDEAERIRGDIQRVMEDISQSAERTGQVAGQFDIGLDGLSGALRNEDGEALALQVEHTRRQTQAMQASVHALQDQVRSGQAEIQRLRADLLRTREQAVRCALSGVLNRRGFDESLERMLAQVPPPGAEHCLVMIDIDHFKRVNDSHGHLVGDKVIAGLGGVLRTLPAEPGMALARYGGEEFAILLPASNRLKAVQVAESVRTRVSQMKLRSKQTQEVRLQVTVSAGVAAWRPGEDAKSFVSSADGALYRAKAAGRDRVSVS
jgi:diguanylate cyclase